jgi:NAD(P)-dependent dehydrogenase (short-subunit alcohol dehydrogenase family)
MGVMNRTCLLTGASGTLGSAFIARFADVYDIVAVRLTHPVYAATTDQQFVDPFSGQQQPRPGVRSVVTDLTDPQAVNDLISLLRREMGQIDLLLNAAAIRAWQPLLRPDSDTVAARVFDVNVIGLLRLTTGVARAFWCADPAANIAANRCVVNISSIAGCYVYPDLGQAMYAASKAALNHLTYHLASEFWDIGVRVNAVAPDTFPGRVATDAVLDAIRDLDAGDQTGQIVPIRRGKPG